MEFFTKDTAGDCTFERARNTGRFLLGYCYNFTRWLPAEANYGYDSNTQFFFGGTAARVQSDIHQTTGEGVVKLPTLAGLQPYAPAGTGALYRASTATIEGAPVLPSTTLTFRRASTFRFENSFPRPSLNSCM